jgi:hypothetical protein
MPVFDPTMTADKAAATLPADVMNASGHASDVAPVFGTKGYIDARRKGKQGPAAPFELDIDKEFKRQLVHIFNVGPFAHIIPCGSAGTFYIPACPETKPFIEMLTPLHVLETENYPINKGKEWKQLRDAGSRMAIEIIGEGRNQDKRNSKRKVGVFIAAGEAPSEKELKEANAQLHVYCSEQVHIMDGVWDRDRKLAYDMFRPETFGACARVLGLTGKDKEWLAQGESQLNTKCEFCKEVVDPSAAICKNCKMPVNEEAYLRMKTKQEEMEQATAPKKAK